MRALRNPSSSIGPRPKPAGSWIGTPGGITADTSGGSTGGTWATARVAAPHASASASAVITPAALPRSKTTRGRAGPNLQRADLTVSTGGVKLVMGSTFRDGGAVARASKLTGNVLGLEQAQVSNEYG